MTKTVTAMLVGRAVRLRKMRIDRPIGPRYPEADRRHAALRPRHLLTMTSGLHRNWVRELSPQENRVRDALSLPFDHRPGRFWEYGQSPVSLLANTVERSVGMDLQDWAQRELFGPIGIPRSAWSWERDRSGNTEGWAHLHMVNAAGPGWASCSCAAAAGTAGGSSPRSYVRKMLKPGKVNNAYGFLVWLNRGGTYTLPNVEGPDTGTGQIVASGPRDMYLMAGSGEQRVFVIPSRDLVIVRLGERGSRDLDTRISVWSGRGGEIDNELVRLVLRSVTDVPYDDPGPYAGSDPLPAAAGRRGGGGCPGPRARHRRGAAAVRAVQVSEFGGPDVLEPAELPNPEPRDDQALIRVLGAGINYADTHTRTDDYHVSQPLPYVPGGEVVGHPRGHRRARVGSRAAAAATPSTPWRRRR